MRLTKTPNVFFMDPLIDQNSQYSQDDKITQTGQQIQINVYQNLNVFTKIKKLKLVNSYSNQEIQNCKFNIEES